MELRARLWMQQRGGQADPEGRSLGSSSGIDIQHSSIFTSNTWWYFATVVLDVRLIEQLRRRLDIRLKGLLC